MPESSRIAELRRRLEKDPASIAFAQLAEEYRRNGDHEQAVRICRDGLARHPGYLSAQVTLGRALMELGFYEEARKELESVLKVASDNLAAIRALAVIHQQRRHASTAQAQQQPDVPVEEPPIPAVTETEPPAPAVSVIEAQPPTPAPAAITVPEIVEEVEIAIVADAPSLSRDLNEPIAVEAMPPMTPDPSELIIPDVDELFAPEESAAIAEAPPLPDFSDWNLDVDLAIDLPGDPVEPLPVQAFEARDSQVELAIDMPGVLAAAPPQLLQPNDPALEYLEQWLAAIVSDRHQSG
jgi:hypothetical protein